MSDCEGHPASEFDPMGETFYCDGSCRPQCEREEQDEDERQFELEQEFSRDDGYFG